MSWEDSNADAAEREGVVVVTMPALMVRSQDAARSMGMGLELFNDCVKHYGFFEKAAVRSNRLTLWEPTTLVMLKNVLKEKGLPPKKKKAVPPAV